MNTIYQEPRVTKLLKITEAVYGHSFYTSQQDIDWANELGLTFYQCVALFLIVAMLIQWQFDEWLKIRTTSEQRSAMCRSSLLHSQSRAQVIQLAPDGIKRTDLKEQG